MRFTEALGTFVNMLKAGYHVYLVFYWVNILHGVFSILAIIAIFFYLNRHAENLGRSDRTAKH